MVQEKYGVRLATQEKGRLRKMIRAGRSSAQAITRARILIKIDEGWTAPQVATAPWIQCPSERACPSPRPACSAASTGPEM